jgi:methyltransferase (TIGR00027 family)
MITAEPSRTAYRVALRRAAHQLLDRPPVLEDPLALAILRPEDVTRLRADPAHFERGPVASFLRAFLAVRARFVEDRLAQLRATGLRQYVVLGAGLDTFPYRVPVRDPPLRVWEIDHPATQAWKRQRLDEARIPIPPTVRLVPVDFERDHLGQALERAGFDPQAGALFGWLGVVPYLTPPAIRATLTCIAAATAEGGGVVFDYARDRDGLSPLERRVYDGFAARVRAIGEPLRSAFRPAELAREVHATGFPVVQDFGREDLNGRYLAGRSDGLQVGSLGRLMWAGREPCGA